MSLQVVKYRIQVNANENIAGAIRVDLNSSNFSDWDKIQEDNIYFEDSQGNKLYFWIEKLDKNNQKAIIWVKANIQQGIGYIYMYVGDTSYSNYNSLYDTFPLADDFQQLVDTNKWTVTNNSLIARASEIICKVDLGRPNQAIELDETNRKIYITSYDANGNYVTRVNMDTCEVELETANAPPHPAGIDYAPDRGTLFISSGGSNTPQIYEVNPDTLEKIRSWDMTNEGYNSGALVAYKGNGQIYLFTSNTSTYDFKIGLYQLNDDGTFTKIQEWSHTSLGVAQGLDYYNGELYYLTGSQTTISKVYKLQLNDDGTITATLVATTTNYEPEGLYVSDTGIYIGNGTGVYIVKVLDKGLAIKHDTQNPNQVYSNIKFSPKTAVRSLLAMQLTFHYPGIGLGDMQTGSLVDDSHSGTGITLGNLHATDNCAYGRVGINGTETETNGCIINDLDQYHIIEIKWLNDKVEFYEDDQLKATINSSPSIQLYAGVGVYPYATAPNHEGFFYIKWIAIYTIYDYTYSITKITETQPPSTTPSTKKKGSVWPFVIAGVVLLFLLGGKPKKREPEKST